MVRALALFGLGALFLLISPVLRGHVMAGLVGFVGLMVKFSPYSYVLGLLVVFLAFVISLDRGTRPR